MLRCTHVRPYWRACETFAIDVLNVKPRTFDPIEAAVFNVDRNLKLINEASRAFFRHAVRWWYAALTRVHREGAVFVWQSTFYKTLTKFREAVIRYAAGGEEAGWADEVADSVGVDVVGPFLGKGSVEADREAVVAPEGFADGLVGEERGVLACHAPRQAARWNGCARAPRTRVV